MSAGVDVATTHLLPRRWGAEFVREGEVRFRVWAPGQPSLTLRLDGDETPMERDEDGWFELLATGVSPGAEYMFVLPDGTAVPDPASRAQAGDVHGPSVIVDPTAYGWRDDWHGRPWEEAVIYELHVGTFTPEGTFEAVRGKLGYLAALGVTAIELMPVGQFSGTRGWGYDGVLPYAPHSAYGTPEQMKALVDEAHGHGLMVLLDVVYNHFGPDGNYLPLLAPDFFDESRHTPWGAGIAYQKAPVRSFFIENALYWLEEFNLDGLRLDAIDQIADPQSPKHMLVELAERVRAEFPDRPVHLTTEDNRNVTHLHARTDGEARLYTAEWNDDFHNAAHVLATGETDGYYSDFADDPAAHLARCLAEGFAYQGEAAESTDGKPRGEPSGHLPPTAFVNFLQNHDQVGNRALGERLPALAGEDALGALRAVLLLSPSIPLLFMGEEYGETRPFLFFADFHDELGRAVREGRRKEFAAFAGFGGEEIPDPNNPATLAACRLDWARANDKAALAETRQLLKVRAREIVPLLVGAGGNSGRVVAAEDGVIAVDWTLSGATLRLRANLSDAEAAAARLSGFAIHAQPAGAEALLQDAGRLPPWGVVVGVEPAPPS